jgi:hypothetical protein
MKTDRASQILLGIVAVLLFINFMNTLFSSKPVLADSQSENTGKYQISAWGAQAQSANPTSGYYVLDTATGMIVASKTEMHKP